MAAASVAAIIACSPASAWIRGKAFGAFQGNPNAIVSSVGGSITSSRTSGQTPCFVHVSASGITAVGTDVPYEDLEFNWNFGDPSGNETFVRPTDGATVNANTAQICPEGFYCYRSAGTYTVTLTVRYQTAPGVYSSRSFTQAITVSAFSAAFTVYYDSNAPGGGDGTSAATAYNTISDLSNSTFWNSNRTNKLIRIARGSSFSGTAGLRISNGASLSGPITGLRVEAYQGPYSASTAKPIIAVSGSSNSNTGIPCDLGSTGLAATGVTKSDFVFSNISFQTIGGTIFSYCIKSVPGEPSVKTDTLAGGYTNMYWDNCDCYSDSLNTGAGALTELVFFSSSWPNGPNTNTGLYGGSYTTALTGSTGRRTLLGLAADANVAVFGISMSGSGGSSLLDHFVYPEVEKWCLYKWVSIGNTGTGSAQLSFFINLNHNGSTQQYNGDYHGFTYPQYQAISECGIASGVTQPPAFFIDGAQSNTPSAVFTGGGSADIDASSLAFGGSYPAGTGVPSVNSLVCFFPLGTLPTSTPQIVAATPYYVVSKATNIIQISETLGGAPITFSTTGSGCSFMVSQFKNLVIERNGLTGFNGGTLLYGTQIASVTWRGNRSWNLASSSQFAPPGAYTKNVTKQRIYNNLIDSPSGFASSSSFTSDLYASGASWTQAQQFTNNVIVDRRTPNSKFTQYDWTLYLSNSSIFKNNAYYTDGTAQFYDQSTAKSLATAQAAGLEVGSTVQAVSANPWGAAPTSWNGFGP